MTTAEKVFIVIIIINTLIAIAYFIWGCIVQSFREKEKPPEEPSGEKKTEPAAAGEAAGEGGSGEGGNGEEEPYEWKLSRTGYLFKSLVILLCPVVGILFFLVTQLMYCFSGQRRI